MDLVVCVRWIVCVERWGAEVEVIPESWRGELCGGMVLGKKGGKGVVFISGVLDWAVGWAKKKEGLG